MRTKILIDFDGTLLDTRRLKKGLFEIFYAAGFSEEEVLETYQLECLDYLYSPINHAERLFKIHAFNQEKFNIRLKKLYGECPEFVFSDVKQFLLHIDRNMYELDIFSLGDSDFQMSKIEASGLVGFFDNIFITSKQKWLSVKEHTQATEKFIFIDDRGDTVLRVSKEYRNSFCVEINRSKNPLDPMESNKDFGNIVVRDFNQFMKYLEPRIKV